MRQLTALTVIVGISGMLGFVFTGQTAGEAKSTEVSERTLIKQFWSAARRQIALDTTFRENKACLSARKAIKFYRSKTWSYQDELRIARSPTVYPEKIPARCGYLRWRVDRWRLTARENRRKLERFRSGSPYQIAKHIVYATFPRSTAAAALTVVDCETGGTYDESATNRKSGVRGYFQIHPGNHGRIFYWRGNSLRLDSSRLYDPWYNTTVAAFMTNGGVNWREWHCQPWVGIG